MSKAKSSKTPAETLFSHHVFLFPFKWAPFTQKEEASASFDKQTNLKPLVEEFRKVPERWRSKAFKIDTLLGYSEYNYFLDYVREILYDLHEDEAKGDDNSDPVGSTSPLYTPNSGTKDVIQHFEYVPSRGKMFYHIKLQGREKPYELEIESFFLHLYYTGVGVFSFHLNNRHAEQANPEDILAINQFGRRLYPIYFDIDQDVIGTQEIFKDQNFAAGLKGVAGKREQGAQREVLAESISVTLGEQTSMEDFADYTNYEKFKHNPFLLPKFIKEFLPEGLFCTHDNPEANTKGRYTISPALDDRMFVVCWYGQSQLSAQLREAFRYEQVYKNAVIEPQHAAIEPALDWWYKYVFVNTKTMTCQNAELRWKNMQNSTNLRWRDQGTFYGVTAYSLVMVTNNLTELKKSNRGFLVTYLQSIYYKLVELVLVQRATVERFADEVTHISRLEDDKNGNELPIKVSALYKQYIRFVNKIYFREVTAQALGSELYEGLQEQASVSKNVKDLDDEIKELHAYVQQTQERKRNNRLAQVSNITAAFLGPSLLIGFYGISSYPQFESPWREIGILWLMLSSYFTGYFSRRIFRENPSYPNQKEVNLRTRYALIPFAIGMAFPLLAPLLKTWVFDNKPAVIEAKHLDVRQETKLKSLPIQGDTSRKNLIVQPPLAPNLFTFPKTN
ncbi:MAG: hypothetical protein SFV55_26735 [Haliscomenobacter sp.]|uniref:hypothetical protein n=1 Tax=Haliscomenobacter sp. TaxID=2717303 RepID=UPI0029B1BC80|nr:hypothetical protein [Haliscomenobacter sp.]MDX2072059.1 hypothetical protein [Haliscomenobacter sp.]